MTRTCVRGNHRAISACSNHPLAFVVPQLGTEFLGHTIGLGALPRKKRNDVHILMVLWSFENLVLTTIAYYPIAWGLAQDDLKGGEVSFRRTSVFQRHIPLLSYSRRKVDEISI